MSFGFWVKFFSKKYETIFAHELTKACFSGYKTKDVYTMLYDILKLRNRIFHHEAIIYKKNLNKTKYCLLELLYKLDGNAKTIIPLIVYE